MAERIPASFLSEAEAADIRDAFADAFETFLVLGEPGVDTVDLLIYRDSNEDGSSVAIGPQRVMVALANVQPRFNALEATRFVGMAGELRKAYPFDIEKGDRFTLPGGASGRIVTSPVRQGALVVASFEIEG